MSVQKVRREIVGRAGLRAGLDSGVVVANTPWGPVVCEDRVYQSLILMRARSLQAVGRPDRLKCGICGQYDLPSSLLIYPGKTGPTGSKFHVSCKREYDAARRSGPVAHPNRKWRRSAYHEGRPA